MAKMKVVIVPPVWWIDGYDYATAERGIQVPPIRDKVPGLSEDKKDRKKKASRGRLAAFLRSLYAD